jgi:thymidylate kinase
MFIIVDSIDGGGKSTVIEAWKETLAKQGNPVFDLKKYMKETGRYPELSELKGYDFVFSAEPTYVGVGAVIRQELIKNGTDYPVEALAEAYALDRLILYNKIHIPLLKNGKCIIQDRSITTSLAYQSLPDPKFTMKKICALPGNKLALEYRPDYLVLIRIDPKEAARRLNERTGKKDDAIFENLPFLKKSTKQFFSPELKTIFTKRGTKVINLNGNQKIDIMRQEAEELLNKILNKNIC